MHKSNVSFKTLSTENVNNICLMSLLSLHTLFLSQIWYNTIYCVRSSWTPTKKNHSSSKHYHNHWLLQNKYKTALSCLRFTFYHELNVTHTEFRKSSSSKIKLSDNWKSRKWEWVTELRVNVFFIVFITRNQNLYGSTLELHYLFQ